MKFWPYLLLAVVFACKSNVASRDGIYPFDQSTFETGKVISKITDKRLLEASGLEYSTKNPGHLWTHNDSQGQPSLYLMDTLGEVKLTVYLKGAENYDWEDITSDGEHLYIAEIGDNRAERESIKIFMLEEPKLRTEDSIAINDWLEMELTYSNGARDAETLMYDFQTGELVIVSKRDESCYLYSFMFEAGTTKSIEPKGQINLRMFTAGDINKEGEMLIKNYNTIFYWPASNLSVKERFVKGPEFTIPYVVEPQGEAITFAPDKSFYTVSEFNEHSNQNVYHYQRKL